MKSFKDYAKILEEERNMSNDNSYIGFDEGMELAEKVAEEFVTPLQKAGNEKWIEADTLLGEYAYAYACEGFINGFIRAMYIMYKATAPQEEAKAV